MDVTPTRVIALASGKGGVGKSFLTLSLAQALVRMGKRVLILDADFGLGNIELLAGQPSGRSAADVMSGRYTVHEVIVSSADGLRVIPAGRGLPRAARADTHVLACLVGAIDQLAGQVDYLLIDTAGGLSSMDMQLIQAAGEVLVVLTPDPLVQLDAVDYIRVLRGHYNIHKFGIVTNMVKRQRDGYLLMETLQQRLGFEQDLVLRYCGQTPLDVGLGKVSTAGPPLFADRADTRVAHSIDLLAQNVNRRRLGEPLSGAMSFFFEHNIKCTRRV